MASLGVYLQSLDYSYLKIYSGFRDIQFEAFSKKMKQEISGLEASLETALYMQKRKIRQQIKNLQKLIDPHNVRLIDTDFNLHPEAQELAILKRGEVLLSELIDVLTLNTPIEAVSACVPVYRDAIIFYNEKEEVTAIIHICFECHRIIDAEGKPLRYGTAAFLELERFFQTKFS